MTFVRKAGLASAAAVLGASLSGLTTPAFAGDSGWGCGGPCITESGDPATDGSGDAESKRARTAKPALFRFADSGWGCGGQC